MNIKTLLATFAAMLGISGIAFAQKFNVGNPFAGLGIEFYGFFLPWIFTFAIVFGLLSKLKLFDQRNINMALAFVVAFGWALFLIYTMVRSVLFLEWRTEQQEKRITELEDWLAHLEAHVQQCVAKLGRSLALGLEYYR